MWDPFESPEPPKMTLTPKRKKSNPQTFLIEVLSVKDPGPTLDCLNLWWGREAASPSNELNFENYCSGCFNEVRRKSSHPVRWSLTSQKPTSQMADIARRRDTKEKRECVARKLIIVCSHGKLVLNFHPWP